MKGYCKNCGKVQEVKSPKKVKLENGKPATVGVCASCGTKVQCNENMSGNA